MTTGTLPAPPEVPPDPEGALAEASVRGPEDVDAGRSAKGGRAPLGAADLSPTLMSAPLMSAPLMSAQMTSRPRCSTATPAPSPG